MYHLFKLMNLPQVHVPESFVVSIRGFRKFMAFNNLYEKIEGPLKNFKDGADAESVSNSIQLLILNGDIPSELRREILKAAETIFPKNPESGLYSVRSSAVGEDGILSFAGLHDSFLNVPFRDLLSSYKKVIASMYNAGSLLYRMNQKIPLTEMNMAVLYQEMIPGKVSGVVYTVDPNFPNEKVCLIGANWGLGKTVVEGNAAVDTFRVSRTPPHAILTTRINQKEWTPDPELPAHIVDEMRSRACLTREEISSVVETALIIERYFNRPLDIEWCMDPENQLKILQARPLGVHKEEQARSRN